MDIHAIKPGDDFVKAVSEAAGSSDVVVVLIGKRWLTSTDDAGRRRLDDPNDIVRLEIRTALEHSNVRLIPALVGGAAMPGRGDLPDDLATLARLNAIEISDTRFDDDVHRLVENLRTPLLTTSADANQGRSTSSSPRYYIYVSDQKVDMLYAQIPETVKRALLAESGRSSRSSESLREAGDRYARLRVVEGYIDRNFDVGTVDDPRSYFRGVHQMKWGPYGRAPARLFGALGLAPEPDRQYIDAKIVYFGGATEKTHFGLGGGLHHVIGNEQGKTGMPFHSSTPYLVSALTDELPVSQATDDRWWNAHKIMMRLEDKTGALDELKALVAVQNAQLFNGPSQRLEFLAKRLLYGKVPRGGIQSQDTRHLDVPNGEGDYVLLGSPIYVALADI